MATMKWLLTVMACLAGVYLVVLAAPASGHHNPDGKLPLVPFTWLIQTTIADGEVRWCVDNRARDLPDFVADLKAVNDAARDDPQAVGIPHRQVQVDIPGSLSLAEAKSRALAAGCMILHRIPDAHGCSGCAAWILYGDKPAVVEYKLTVIATYNDLKTTQSHEGTNCGHAMGEHEGYIDSGPDAGKSHRLTYGYWASPWNGPTVMDVGSHLVVVGGVWRCTENDTRLICSWIDPNGQRFRGCGYQPAQQYPFWANGRWWFEDGWSFAPNSGCGEWFMPDNRLAWGACADWGGRWNNLVQVWTMPSSTYHPASNIWWSGGLVLP